MQIQLSARLRAVAAFVAPAARVADVGCDHGYLGIHLLTREDPVASVIAADLRPAPLAVAVKNAKKYGVSENMSFYLCDGVQKLPHDFDTLICAGMGADTIISILSDAPWLKNEQYHLIVQCQSKTHLLRRYLSDEGWHIAQESVLRDGRFLYTVMDVFYKPDHPPLTPGQCYFPPAMTENPCAQTAEYYRRLLRGLRLICNARGEAADPALPSVLAELEALAHDPNLSFLKEETP